MMTIDEMLAVTGARHAEICPRQVLGIRMGLLAGDLLALDLPRQDKRLLIIVETDGCTVDGVEAATGCTPGHRTLRIEDMGKVAATFIDTLTQRAVRIVPRPESRSLAASYAPPGLNRWEAQRAGYQCMPADLLLAWSWVELRTPLTVTLGAPGLRVACAVCGEEVINGREVTVCGRLLCRACAGVRYYTLSEADCRDMFPARGQPSGRAPGD